MSKQLSPKHRVTFEILFWKTISKFIFCHAVRIFTKTIDFIEAIHKLRTMHSTYWEKFHSKRYRVLVLQSLTRPSQLSIFHFIESIHILLNPSGGTSLVIRLIATLRCDATTVTRGKLETEYSRVLEGTLRPLANQRKLTLGK